MGSLIKYFAICLLPLVACQIQLDIDRQANEPEKHDFLDIESPDFFSFTTSPLAQPESLKSQPYYDFLSTLYAHDHGKSSLFTGRPKSKREVVLSPILDALQSDVPLKPVNIRKRAIVFRPLFVYRQQQVRKQKLQEERRRY